MEDTACRRRITARCRRHGENGEKDLTVAQVGDRWLVAPDPGGANMPTFDDALAVCETYEEAKEFADARGWVG
jgi:hypothetical protein